MQNRSLLIIEIFQHGDHPDEDWAIRIGYYGIDIDYYSSRSFIWANEGCWSREKALEIARKK